MTYVLMNALAMVPSRLNCKFSLSVCLHGTTVFMRMLWLQFHSDKRQKWKLHLC